MRAVIWRRRRRNWAPRCRTILPALLPAGARWARCCAAWSGAATSRSSRADTGAGAGNGCCGGRRAIRGAFFGVIAIRPRPRCAGSPIQRARSASARALERALAGQILGRAAAEFAAVAVVGRRLGERREQAEIDVHRLERGRAGVDGLDVAAGDVGEQRAMRGGRRRRLQAFRRAARRRQSARRAGRWRPIPHSPRSR